MNSLQTTDRAAVLAANRTPEQRRKRRIKAARAIIRLQYSLAGDDEIDAMLAEEEEAFTAGVETRLNTSLQGVLGS